MKEKILYNLKTKGTFYRFNAILDCVNNQIITKEIADELIKLKKDYRVIAGYKISDFSIAALDILGIEKYSDGNLDIINLINCKMKLATAIKNIEIEDEFITTLGHTFIVRNNDIFEISDRVICGEKIYKIDSINFCKNEKFIALIVSEV